MTTDTSMITCEICSAKTHSIRRHIADVHADEWTESRYKEEFPDSPLMSPIAEKRVKEALSKKKAAEAASVKELPAVKSNPGATNIKTLSVAMGDAFKLGDNKLTRSAKTGNPIMITALDKSTVKEPQFIPQLDPGYIFDIEVLKTLIMGIELKIPTYLYGHAGLGKSSIFEQIAAATNRPIRRVQHTVNTEESHIVGQYVVNHVEDPVSGELKAKTEFQYGDLPLAMMNGEIFLADEYDRSYPSVLSVYQAVLEGKPLHIKDAPEEMRVVHPHPEFRFVATGNTNGAGDDTGLYQATVVQDAATFERFGIVEKIDYMPANQEIGILKSKCRLLEPDAKKIVDFARKIRSEAFPNSVSLTLGPRVLINIGKIGLARSNMQKGIEVAYANRLPEVERRAALDIAQRFFGRAS